MRNVNLRPARDASAFRRLAMAAWDPPRDPSFHGSLELDATAALAYIEALHERTGEHVTITHLVGRALAIALAERPELNVLVRWRRLYPRADVDIFFQVALTDEHGAPTMLDLSGLVIRRADHKSVVEIAREFGQRLDQIRHDCDPELAGVRRRLARIPALLLRPLHLGLDVLQYSFNVQLPGFPRDSFGSVAVTNIGMYGVRWGYAPFFPPAHWPIVVLVGAVQQRPWVVHGPEGPRVAVRPVLPLHATLDHRVLDGVQAAQLSARIEELLLQPERLDLARPG